MPRKLRTVSRAKRAEALISLGFAISDTTTVKVEAPKMERVRPKERNVLKDFSLSLFLAVTVTFGKSFERPVDSDGTNSRS